MASRADDVLLDKELVCLSSTVLSKSLSFIILKIVRFVDRLVHRET